MENLRSPFENIFNIIGGLPQGHEKPLKHALYNAVALLFLVLCSGATWALYIILEPFVKPLIWALLVGSVLHPLKNTLAKKVRSWFDKLDESRTPIIIGVAMLPVDIVDDLSEFIGGKLLKRIKIIVALVVTVPLIHVFYYYTPTICTCIAWKLGAFTHTTVNWLIAISTTSTISVLLIGYISIVAVFWKPATNKRFSYISLAIWLLVSCYLSHLAGSFQVSIFIALQMICLGGFIYEVGCIHDKMTDKGKSMTYIEAALLALENNKIEETTPEEEEGKSEVKHDEAGESLSETKEDTFTDKDPWNLELFENKSTTEMKETEQIIAQHASIPKTRVHHLKPQRSLSHPSPMSRFNRLPKNVLDRKRNIPLLFILQYNMFVLHDYLKILC